MELPSFLLERVFLYLSWNDRSRAARVCRKWLEVFHSPSLWRTMVVHPPNRSLSRVQYDMRAYYLSCCLRTIGWYVKSYRFLPTEDIFLLNRSLSVIARFFECNTRAQVLGTPDSDDLDQKEAGESDQHYEAADDEDLILGSDVGANPQASRAQLSNYLGAIQGDPDAEATLRLILKMQAREYLGLSSDSDEDDDGDNWSSEADFPDEFIRHCGSLPTAQLATTISPPVAQRRLNRSVSCYQPQQQRRRPAPIVLCFSLDFYCELDESQGHVYGTGGALLSTIQRVVRQLTQLQCLRLTNLFLSPADARRLIADVAAVAADSLVDMELTHLSKPLPEADLARAVGRVQVLDPSDLSLPAAGGNKDWYLLDPRWLGARPHPSRANPLAELPALFPHLTRLTLAITQLTGPMLLRLLHQTCLREICFVQTELTAFTLVDSGGPAQSGVSSRLHPANPQAGSDDSIDEFWLSGDQRLALIDLNGDLIDWAADVPQCIPGCHRLATDQAAAPPLRRQISVNTSLVGWRPITSSEWSAALALRPGLSLTLGLVSAGRLVQANWSTAGADLWPEPPAPVRSVVVTSRRAVSDAMQMAFQLSRPVNLSTYRNTLTRLVLVIQLADPQPTGRCSTDFNEAIFKVCCSCRSLRVIAFGGNTDYLHITTLFNICRLRAGRNSRSGEGCTWPGERSIYSLVVEASCCCCSFPLSANGEEASGAWVSRRDPDCLSATTSTWCAMVFEAGPTVEARLAAAERCISTALGRVHWKFLTASQFQSRLANWLPSTS